MENKFIEQRLRDIDRGVELGLITKEMADKLKIDAFNTPRQEETQGSDSVAAAVAALAESNRRERNRDEWMDHKDRSVALWKSLEDMANSATLMEDYRAEFHRRARYGHLSPEEVTVLSILLRGDSFDLGGRMLAGYILRTPVEKRARIHNWALIESFKEGSSWELVERVEKLQLPLFPEELNDLNIRLANFAAGGDSSAARELYRTTRDPVLFGGGYLPVYGSDGAQIGVTDNADNERAFHETMNQFAGAIASLEKRFQDFSRITRTPSSMRGGDNSRIIRQKMEELQRLLDYGDYDGASRGRSSTPRRTTSYAGPVVQQPAARRAPTPRRSGSANRMQPRYNGGGEVRIADGSAASSAGTKN